MVTNSGNKISVSISEDLLEKIDAIAAKEKRSRSAMIGIMVEREMATYKTHADAVQPTASRPTYEPVGGLTYEPRGEQPDQEAAETVSPEKEKINGHG